MSRRRKKCAHLRGSNEYSEVQDWLTHQLFKLTCSGKEEIMVAEGGWSLNKVRTVIQLL